MNEKLSKNDFWVITHAMIRELVNRPDGSILQPALEKQIAESKATSQVKEPSQGFHPGFDPGLKVGSAFSAL